jgi:hypothetical protein
MATGQPHGAAYGSRYCSATATAAVPVVGVRASSASTSTHASVVITPGLGYRTASPFASAAMAQSMRHERSASDGGCKTCGGPRQPRSPHSRKKAPPGAAQAGLIDVPTAAVRLGGAIGLGGVLGLLM